MNSPQYTKEELEKFRTDNEKGVTVDGVHYTGYQATQMQRSLERAIRRQKNRVMVDEGAGDKEKLAQNKTKLEMLHQRYREFSRAAGLRTQYERTEVAGFGENFQQKHSSIVFCFADGTSEDDRRAVEKEFAHIPEKAMEIASPYVSKITITNEHFSRYNISTGEMFLNRSRESGTVAHEIAHAIEKATNLYEDPEFLRIREKGLENLGPSDIIIDTKSFPETVYRISSSKFVSAYQGRLYEYFGLYDGKRVLLDGMLEYFSEGFMFYVIAPDILMKKDKDLFDYIRRLLE